MGTDRMLSIRKKTALLKKHRGSELYEINTTDNILVSY